MGVEGKLGVERSYVGSNKISINNLPMVLFYNLPITNDVS